MKVAFLMPCRRRLVETRESIESVMRTVSSETAVQFCVRLDDDDLPLIELVDEMKAMDSRLRSVVGPRNNGYGGLHNLYNDALSLVDDDVDFVVVWGNENYMLTDTWDVEMARAAEKDPLVMWLDRSVSYPLFPILNKGWFGAIESFNENKDKFPRIPEVDSYVHETMKIVLNKAASSNMDRECFGVHLNLATCNLKLQDEVWKEHNKFSKIDPLSKCQFLELCAHHGRELFEIWKHKNVRLTEQFHELPFRLGVGVDEST